MIGKLIKFIMEVLGFHTKELTEKQLDQKEKELKDEEKKIEEELKDLEKKLEDKTLEEEVSYWKDKK
jgi:cell division protein FtsB